MSNLIEIEKEGRILVIRFTRPEIRNPLSVLVIDELNALFDRLDAGTTAVVFTGSQGVFASGADLREIAKVSPDNARAFAECGQKLMARISSLSQRTIAAVN